MSKVPFIPALYVVFSTCFFSMTSCDCGPKKTAQDSVARANAKADSTQQASNNDSPKTKDSVVAQRPGTIGTPDLSSGQAGGMGASAQSGNVGGHIHPPALPVAPRYKDGEAALQKYISGNKHYPDAAKQANVTGVVVVDFTVKADGTISNAKIRQGLGHGCDEEALRLVKAMPAWQPGKKDGQAVDMEYSLSIVFP